MAQLQTKTYVQLIQDQAAAVQGYASGLVDFTVGAIMRAFAQSIAQTAMWLQGMILTLLQTTRLSTSKGSDVDSFVGDFGMTREAAVAATGSVTFSRFSATTQAVVPIGATVETGDGSEQYSVVVDATNPAYSAPLGGYVLAVGISSVTAPVAASVAGASGNVVAGAISVITSAIPGVDTVTNALAITDGLDAQTDDQVKAAFPAYLQSLARATLAAVEYAATSVKQGSTCTVTENQTWSGITQYGHFSVVVDDGSGNPPSSFLSAVYAAVDAVRPLGSTFEVHGPTLITATASLQISTAVGYVHATVATQVQAAISTYIAALPVGATLSYNRLIQIAFDASPGVSTVTAFTLNGGTSDIIPNATGIIRPGMITVI